MEITDFVKLIQDNCFNPLSKLAAQHVQSLLNQDCGIKEIEVGAEVFEDIIQATGLTPNVGSIYYFIRIDDLGNNTVDIQTRKNNER